MDQELQKYYEEYLTTFSRTGWKQLKNDIAKAVEEVKTRTMAQDSETQFHFNRGYIAALQLILMWDKQVKNAYNELTSSEEDVNELEM